MSALPSLFGDFRWHDRITWRPNAPADLRHDLDSAISQLEELYPAKFLAAASEDQLARFAPLFLGFIGFGDGLSRLLYLGRDLALCSGWESELGLLALLRSADEWESGRLEVGIWAGAVRHGCAVDYEPRANRFEKAPDLVITEGGFRVAIEAKCIGTIAHDANIGDVEGVISDAVWREQTDVPAHTIRIYASDELRLAVAMPRAHFRDVTVPAIQAATTTWWQSSAGFSLFGPRDPIPGVGSVEIVPSSRPGEWGVVVSGLERLGIIREVARALARVRNANKQVAAAKADLSVAVVWTPHFTMPADEMIQLLEPFILEKPDAYESLDYIAILNSHRHYGLKWTTEAKLHRLPWARRRADGMAWPNAITSWRLSF